jgi:Transmembrane secretion effector
MPTGACFTGRPAADLTAARARPEEVTRGMAGSGTTSSTWAPLRTRTFRVLWIAALAGNVGTWPEPQLMISADQDRGPVLVRIAYTVAPDKQPQFLEVMPDLRLSRERTGATGWDLYQDGENPRSFVELFTVPTWDEHLLQHRERQTGADLQFHDAAAALSDPPPQIDHYLAVGLPQQRFAPPRHGCDAAGTQPHPAAWRSGKRGGSA